MCVCVYFLCCNLSAIVRPRAELHDTRLLIEREILHVDFAGRFVNGRWLPGYLAGVFQCGLCHQRHLVISVRAEEKKRKQCFDARSILVLKIYGINHFISSTEKKKIGFFLLWKILYLLYNTISGSHMFSEGTYNISTPPYSCGSHVNL